VLVSSIELTPMQGRRALYDDRWIDPGYANVPCMQKPVSVERLIQGLFG
jgi:hypothetical protein